MAKCKLCGKSSLFLKVNLDGICQDCVNNQKNNIIKEIRMVNDYVISFMNNKDLLTICEKFVEKDETLYLEALDLIYVPIIAPKNFNISGHYSNVSEYKFKYPDNINVINSSYIEILKTYKYENLYAAQCNLFVASAIREAGIDKPFIFNEKDKVYDCISHQMNKIRTLFKILCNQSIIGNEQNIYKYFAFIFILNICKKALYAKIAGNYIIEKNLSINIDEFSINNDEQIRTIIQELHFQKENDSQIFMFLLSLGIAKHFNTPINKLNIQITSIFNDYIKDIKEKEFLDKLRSDKTISIPKYNLTQIDLMDSVQFENYVADIFNMLGYKTKNTKLSGDQGVDVIAEKDNKIIAIQVKHYSQPVGNHAIMEVVGGARFYNATLCYVITNNYFTKSARQLADANNVILWDRDTLKEKLSEI